RELLPAFLEFEELFFDGAGFRHSEHECVVGPRAVDVERDPSRVESVDVLEEQGGGGFPVEVGGGSSGRAEVRFEGGRSVDVQELFLGVQGGQETAQVIERGLHGFSFRNAGTPSRRRVWGYSGVPAVPGRRGGLGRCSPAVDRASARPFQRRARGAGRSNWSRMRATRGARVSSGGGGGF